jgi:hypothetical protein
MRVTRDNYEAFFLDYLEGNLEEDKVDQFLDFLEQNPDLKEELQLFEQVPLPDEQISYSGKQYLYKSTDDKQPARDNRMIALLEGDLDEDERKSFEAYLTAHPKLQKEYELFSKTRLVPDKNIHFLNKKNLYRKPGYVIALNWAARAAAVLVLVWGINSLLPTINQSTQQKPASELAQNRTNIKPPAKKIEPEKRPTEKATLGKTTSERYFIAAKLKSTREQSKGHLEEKISGESKPGDRDLTAMPEMTPILASLNVEPAESQLAVHHSVKVQTINDPKNIMTIEEFLASRAKKAGNEGLLSAQRILRAGLGVASELSGERIGYSEQNGKITSIGFESKLMAFSIPLKKK